MARRQDKLLEESEAVRPQKKKKKKTMLTIYTASFIPAATTVGFVFGKRGKPNALKGGEGVQAEGFENRFLR